MRTQKTETRKQMSASEITKEALRLLRERGYVVWRQNQIPVKGRCFTGKLGLSDIIGWYAWKTTVDYDTTMKAANWVACEVKAGKDKLSKEQHEFLTELKRSGGIALLAIEVGGKVVLVDYD